MTKKNSLFFILSSFLMLINACKKDSTLEPGRWYDEYFPAVAGTYITYACDSLVYNNFTNEIDTFNFLIKEYYESAFTDNAGRPALRLERWKQEHPDSTWFIKDVWFVVKTKEKVEKIEEDFRLTKLVFPVRQNKEWDANALNVLNPRIFEYDNIHQPFNVLNQNFDSTVTTINTDPANLVNEYRNTEVYGLNKGLIYRSFVDVQLRTDTLLSLPWYERIRTGVIFTMKAVEFGVE
jgi:hypothetical protein